MDGVLPPDSSVTALTEIFFQRVKMTNLTIAIPTYNSPDIVANCISSLFMNTDIAKFNARVVVVNNGSYPLVNLGRGGSIEVHDIGRNLGWMKAINYVLDRDKADSDFFVMMNDDLLFVPGSDTFWKRLVETARIVNVGMVGPSSNYVSGYQNAWWHTPWSRVNCGYIIGMLSMIDAYLFKELGGLDENLPGGDDLDLSLRVRKHGFQLAAVRHSYVHHIGSQTGKREQADYWDSQRHQAETYNAIIKKHGVKAYWEMLNWNPSEL